MERTYHDINISADTNGNLVSERARANGLSTAAPLDANGKLSIDILAAHLKRGLSIDANGKLSIDANGRLSAGAQGDANGKLSGNRRRRSGRTYG